MILGSHRSCVVGQRYLGLTDAEGGVHHDQPFVVLRVATADEYVAEAIADGLPLSTAQLHVVRGAFVFFYEVSVD